MDDRRVSELEAAVADLGPLLVRLEKYRAGRAPAAEALRRDALALGDEARRLHRHGGLDDLAAARLLGATRALHDRLAAAIRAVLESGGYRAAVAAHARGDQEALAPAVLGVFADLERAASATLHATVAWRRRGRPIAPAPLAEEIAARAADGLPGEGDDLAGGADPDLPVVAFDLDPPSGEPVVLRFEAAVLPPVYRLGEAGERLVYAASLRAPFTVLLGRDPGAEQARVELDFTAWRAELRAALRACGLRVEEP